MKSAGVAEITTVSFADITLSSALLLVDSLIFASFESFWLRVFLPVKSYVENFVDNLFLSLETCVKI